MRHSTVIGWLLVGLFVALLGVGQTSTVRADVPGPLTETPVEVTDVPLPTETPVSTETPVATETPVPTDTPTEQPVPTETPTQTPATTTPP